MTLLSLLYMTLLYIHFSNFFKKHKLSNLSVYIMLSCVAL